MLEWLPLILLVTGLILYGIIRANHDVKKHRRDPFAGAAGEDPYLRLRTLQQDSGGETMPGRDDYA